MDTTALDRQALADWYRRNRQRSRELFELVKPAARFALTLFEAV
jgi:hypothetical protein